MSNPREWTCRLLEAIDGGLLDSREVVNMCVSYMSEWDVQDMIRANDLREYLKPSEVEDE